ncbi:MAG: hypothetical protein LIO70_01130 [Clostridiales bacterium]|nr:hypothetical protein [Clostridiales bacterium]
MAYTKTTWASGDTISKTRLNNMEAGIAAAALQADVKHLPGVTTTYDNAGAHNSIFRGASLGSAITSTQASNISSGKFTDLYIGDYWTINGVNWRIAAFDYWYRCGSTSLTTHHAVVVPDTVLYNAPMNASNTTDGAYVGSAMYTGEEITVSGTTYTGLTNAIAAIESAFGDYVLTHDAYLANAVTSGYPSAQAWYTDRVCDLMTEQMVYGSAVMQQMSHSGTLVANRRIEKSQLPLFALAPQYINIRAAWWLRDVVSASYFASVYANGYANATNASSVLGVRPAFLVS